MKSKISFILLPFICVLIGCLNKDKQEKEKFDDVLCVRKESREMQASPAGGSTTLVTYMFPARIAEYHDDILVVRVKTSEQVCRLIIIDMPVQELSPDSVGSKVLITAQRFIGGGHNTKWYYSAVSNEVVEYEPCY